jgi:hypothetical protein
MLPRHLLLPARACSHPHPKFPAMGVPLTAASSCKKRRSDYLCPICLHLKQPQATAGSRGLACCNSVTCHDPPWWHFSLAQSLGADRLTISSMVTACLNGPSLAPIQLISKQTKERQGCLLLDQRFWNQHTPWKEPGTWSLPFSFVSHNPASVHLAGAPLLAYPARCWIATCSSRYCTSSGPNISFAQRTLSRRDN